jgi:hypothetical protein
MQRLPFTQKRYSQKTSKHENIHVLQTAQPSRLFYFNNELRLDNTVERKTNQNIYITSDEKLKRRLFHRKQYIFNFLTSIRYFYTKKESKIKQQTKLNQRECKPLMMSFWSGSKNPSCEEVEVLHQDVYSMGKWDRRSNIIIPKKRLNKT